jgi:curved DNA-binding protein CbpA
MPQLLSLVTNLFRGERKEKETTMPKSSRNKARGGQARRAAKAGEKAKTTVVAKKQDGPLGAQLFILFTIIAYFHFSGAISITSCVVKIWEVAFAFAAFFLLLEFAFAAFCALSFIAGVGNYALLLLLLHHLPSGAEESQDNNANNNEKSGANNNNNGNRSKASNSNDKNNDDDPFKILGLDRGNNNTIEEATKARRKLALKWHPDRNIGNEEVATKKMQEINDAFLKVEKILEEGGDDDDNIRESDGDKPHNEQDARRRQRHQRKKAAAEAAAYQRTKSKFESDVKKEFHNYERARRNASKGVFNESPPPSGKKSRSAKKNARQRAKKKKALERKNRSREAAQCRSPSDGNVGSSRNEIPFHQLPLVQRCEIKFQSKEVVKSAVFYGKEYFIYLHMRFIYSFFKSDEISRILFWGIRCSAV